MSSSVCEPVTLEIPDASSPGALAPARPQTTQRVLHVINGEHYSGAERVQDLLALNLAPFGFEVGFAGLKPGRFAAMRQSRSPLVELGMKSRFDLRPALRLARLIRDEGYALVHTHTPRAALVGRCAAALAGVPLVHHVHSPTASDSTRSWQNAVNAWIERASLIGVSSVIAVSRTMAGYARARGIGRGRISVVANGVPATGPLAVRRPPNETWTLGTVALFRPRKGLEALLEALAILRRNGHDVVLRAVGEFETADYEKAIRERVEQLGIGNQITWVGFTRDVPAELARMDLFVLPSLFGEGLPMVILEAMAAGVPVVATRVEGVPEAIRDGVDGVIAAPGDPQDLARAIGRYVRGEVDWSSLREQAHWRQAESFSEVSMARGVAEAYRKVLNP